MTANAHKVLAFKKLRQEDCHTFEAILHYSCLKKKKKEKK